MYGECVYRKCVIRQWRMQTGDKGFFVALIVIIFVLNKYILLVDNVNPLLLFCALIEVNIFSNFGLRVIVIRVKIIWS